jgi:hypothetical protein
MTSLSHPCRLTLQMIVRHEGYLNVLVKQQHFARKFVVLAHHMLFFFDNHNVCPLALGASRLSVGTSGQLPGHRQCGDKHHRAKAGDGEVDDVLLRRQHRRPHCFCRDAAGDGEVDRRHSQRQGGRSSGPLHRV